MDKQGPKHTVVIDMNTIEDFIKKINVQQDLQNLVRDYLFKSSHLSSTPTGKIFQIISCWTFGVTAFDDRYRIEESQNGYGLYEAIPITFSMYSTKYSGGEKLPTTSWRRYLQWESETLLAFDDTIMIDLLHFCDDDGDKQMDLYSMLTEIVDRVLGSVTGSIVDDTVRDSTHHNLSAIMSYVNIDDTNNAIIFTATEGTHYDWE